MDEMNGHGRHGEFSREFGDNIERVRHSLDSGTDRIKERIGVGLEQLSTLVASADRTIESILGRFEDTAHETEAVLKTVEETAAKASSPLNYVRRNPLPALAGAAIAGMVIGAMFRREGGFLGRTKSPHLHVASTTHH